MHNDFLKSRSYSRAAALLRRMCEAPAKPKRGRKVAAA
jgi:hypothetical protein